MSNVRRIGVEAEDRAADHLLSRGYTLVTRRYRARGGEIDLIVLDGETLVFVEVKARLGGRFATEESVTPLKKSRVMKASAHYLERYDGPERTVRYDLIAIDANGLRHHEAAFEPE